MLHQFSTGSMANFMHDNIRSSAPFEQGFQQYTPSYVPPTEQSQCVTRIKPESGARIRAPDKGRIKAIVGHRTSTESANERCFVPHFVADKGQNAFQMAVGRAVSKW
jgi:hypothetical protein